MINYKLREVVRYVVESTDADGPTIDICEIDSEAVAQQILATFKEAARIYAQKQKRSEK